MSTVRRLNEPLPARVALGVDRRPTSVQWSSHGCVDVEHVLDAWCVDDRWWTDAPVRRVYYECQLQDGTRRVLVYDMVTECWYVQR